MTAPKINDINDRLWWAGQISLRTNWETRHSQTRQLPQLSKKVLHKRVVVSKKDGTAGRQGKVFSREWRQASARSLVTLSWRFISVWRLLKENVSRLLSSPAPGGESEATSGDGTPRAKRVDRGRETSGVYLREKNTLKMIFSVLVVTKQLGQSEQIGTGPISLKPFVQ